MSIALFANVLTIILCVAVLVQSMRMMRSLRAVKDGALTDVVKALDHATVQARSVLSDMKQTLGTDCARHARLVEQARDLRDELSDMIGIADSACERIVSAVSLANALRVAGEEAAAQGAEAEASADETPATREAA
ncbi:hypothetical protein CA233_00230 [Sphingomonas sp. ABOLD]|uniref:DUF6468 domain-containing protein n=1 Tax=Sphingomonas trueperi TaxID=53317 RepID=A0A7X6BDE9_9SPHN|nr:MULTISPECIES: DUF6468 domain-containing protein [Sphingomonas]NJB97637.1 hypothetical protein [Sphingomonas trueperi]RSV43548.1 hypothetical protein CA234_04935 [Sphingomonas sp. ABOLE]RSV52843.1 hypothetical protein CA233_00230 [Sphingomonas sp. ABOLD]